MADAVANSYKADVFALDGSCFFAERVPLLAAGSFKAAWCALLEQALEPNPFYHPDYLTGVAQHVLGHEAHEVILVWSCDHRRELVGVFPVTVKGFTKGDPFGVLCFSFDSLFGVCTPLISPLAPEQVWARFIDYVQSDAHLPNIIHIPEFYRKEGGGLALETLIAQDQVLVHVEQEFQRAVASPLSDYDAYIARWSKKKARNIRSREKKLRGLGALQFDIIERGAVDFGDEFARFLELETGGWKGAKGTALASRADSRAFVKQVFQSDLPRSLGVHLAVLRLDGEMIAAQLNLHAQDHVFFIKSAYDERLSTYGPGVLLYKWMLEQMLSHKRFVELDSCADAHHSLEEIWLERKTVQAVLLALNTPDNQVPFQRLVAWRRFLQRSKSIIKGLRADVSAVFQDLPFLKRFGV